MLRCCACCRVPVGGQSHLAPFAAAQFIAWGKLLFPQRLFPRLTHVVFLIISSLKIIIKLAFALEIKATSQRFSAVTVSAGVMTYFPIAEFGPFLDTKRPNASDEDLIGGYLAVALVNRCSAYVEVHVVGATRQRGRGGGGGGGGWGGGGWGEGGGRGGGRRGGGSGCPRGASNTGTDGEGQIQAVTATLLVKAASVELLPLLFGHPGPFAVRAVLGQEPLWGRGAAEGAGREAPAVLHEDLPVDPLHQVVDEDRPPQVHLRVVDEPELLQGHVKDVRSLLKNGDGFTAAAAECWVRILLFRVLPLEVCDLGCAYRIWNSPVM